MRTLTLVSLLALCFSLVTGCSCSSPPGGGVDSGGTDDASNRPDAVGVDGASAEDAAHVDAAEIDAAPPGDAGRVCTPTTDCGIGFYCHTPDGICAGSGICEALDPTAVCPGTTTVCGCDGNDYLNACDAARLGQSIDHVGSCDSGPPCTSDADCAGGSGPEFCETADGACGGAGTCVSRGIGVFCAMICAPQCGCDGVTYENACLRRRAATSLGQEGVCLGDPPPCTAGGACCSIGSAGDCEVGQECVPASDGAGAPSCQPVPPPPDCFVDADCGVGSGRTCVGAFVCGCGAACPRPTATGTCE
jgi:hypothetical protein